MTSRRDCCERFLESGSIPLDNSTPGGYRGICKLSQDTFTVFYPHDSKLPRPTQIPADGVMKEHNYLVLERKTDESESNRTKQHRQRIGDDLRAFAADEAVSRTFGTHTPPSPAGTRKGYLR